MPRLLIALVLALALPSCASTAGVHAPAAGDPVRVTLYLTHQGQEMGLATAAHTDPVELYSSPRGRGTLKVASDEVVLDVVDYLGENGFDEREQSGRAPRGGAFTICLEIESSAGVTHWGTRPGVTPAEEHEQMKACMAYFIRTYNGVQAFQAVDNPDGAELFDENPQMSAPLGSGRNDR